MAKKKIGTNKVKLRGEHARRYAAKTGAELTDKGTCDAETDVVELTGKDAEAFCARHELPVRDKVQVAALFHPEVA